MAPSSTADARTARPARRPVQVIALLLGVVFLAVGVLGFVPGVTTHYADLRFAGPDSGAQLLGVFAVSVLHNLVHLGYGVAGLVTARWAGAARAFLVLGGGVYLLLWIYGVLVDRHSPANFVPLDSADNWLHLGLGLGMLALGVAGTAVERAQRRYPPPEQQGQ
ncbi:protein of unknown function [Amycolatopsis arida]|uniref:DUF4383 domain-containing protein n=1 Tax=Amycolatopsis arida TaxID=587909 RepID=A0A1I5ZB21_9PSEU|nr:DUF4383 domain-containing protein [Amycolatopsis arida]TDX89483.1 uncharacterized protein DUF4383 [Amycolatopsis arida]SFQ53716.1 protein of unknown function [Amycolatopsis arida]